MRTLPRTVKYTFVSVGLVLFVAGAFAVGKRGVEYGSKALGSGEENRPRDISVVIRPEAKISGAEAEQIKQVLQKFDKKLYTIQTYDNGKAQGDPIGDLKKMRKGVARDIKREAEATQFTGIALQVGQMFAPCKDCAKTAGEHPTPPQPTPSLTPAPTEPGPSTWMVRQTRQAIRELKPLLDKYNKK